MSTTSAARTTWDFYSAGRVHFGSGAVRHLGRLAGRFPSARVLIVTDPVLAAAGHVDRVRQPLAASGRVVEVFDGGEPEPSLSAASAALSAARAFRPDAVLGLGGGSNIDLAKITAVAMTHGGEFTDYFGFDKVPGPTSPVIAVPTTSGTGSEVSHAAVLTDPAERMKFSILSPFLRPSLAVVDPELTHSCPPKVTADSGIDALTHAIEGFTAIDHGRLDAPRDEDCPYGGKNPLADCFAERAIALIGRHLRTAVREPGNAEAREGMALAATLAGLAFSNSAVAVVHALEYPVGGAVHVSHGAGNGLLLPYVMRFNLPERQREFARIADLLGEDIIGLFPEEAAEKAVAAVEQLRSDVGIPQRLRDIGVTEDQLPGFAQKAFAVKRLMNVNPRQPTEGDLLDILRAAF
jgi:alcohol dehydrogenase class IV